MTAELWLREAPRPDDPVIEPEDRWVRLNPDRELVVPDDWARPAHITVQDILDALTEQETD